MAHDPYALEPQASRDLLRTEILAQQPFDDGEVVSGVAPVTPGTAAPAVALLDGEKGPIGSVVLRAVTLHLAINGARMPLQLPCNLKRGMPAGSHRGDRVSFFGA
jgi:hypothetical protein